MTHSDNFSDTASNDRAIKAEFVRVLSDRVRSISGDPKLLRETVYELARIKLQEQFTHQNVRETWETLRILERAIAEVEVSFERNPVSASPPPGNPAIVTAVPPDVGVGPPPAKLEQETRRPTPPPEPARPKRTGAFSPVMRLVAILLGLASGVALVAYWPRLATSLAVLQQRSPPTTPQPASPPRENEVADRAQGGQSDGPAGTASSGFQSAQPAMPLPTTFGVYALSDGQLQELKSVPGKIPDRRVAISAAITTPSATTLTSGDARFIVFRPDGGVDASGTEVRVVAKVLRAMGVDASGKASMVNAGDSWVIRSMSFPYKVGPVEEQPRMLQLQPETDGFTLTPGRYVIVVKGIGYDFTVAGEATDPNQCVERINATNGAFYSPCPPRR
ncbi:hypothetical protein [Bradyrhizobium arachidis]|uniref:hypothetical protein n=1 Tax=Bradyrhizobium arachidis TaxID=858423 RepID=UPI0021626E35|nr:hypothetical protein [Bradyrhizobium arachidis]UVO27627.1 hypothetical protein KUF59_34925 [Bradyrhizobium arachidis]